MIPQLLATGSLLIDWLQTLQIKKHRTLKEQNKILGPHPSDLKVSIYFLAIISVFLSVSLYFDNQTSLVVSLILFLFEVGVIINNIIVFRKYN